MRVEFPESLPFNATGPLVVFNGGEKGGVTTLFIQAYVSVPTPTALVTTIKIKKVHQGPYGLESVATIPVIAGGSGSVTNFSLKIGKTFTYKGKKQSYLEAKCSTAISWPRPRLYSATGPASQAAWSDLQGEGLKTDHKRGGSKPRRLSLSSGHGKGKERPIWGRPSFRERAKDP